MWRAGVLGATGHTEAGLPPVLFGHSDIHIALITSNTHRGKKVSEVFPQFRSLSDCHLPILLYQRNAATLQQLFFLCP